MTDSPTKDLRLCQCQEHECHADSVPPGWACRKQPAGALTSKPRVSSERLETLIKIADSFDRDPWPDILSALQELSNRRAFDTQHVDSSLGSKADSWRMVWDLLKAHNPEFYEQGETGRQAVEIEIRRLQTVEQTLEESPDETTPRHLQPDYVLEQIMNHSTDPWAKGVARTYLMRSPEKAKESPTSQTLAYARAHDDPDLYNAAVKAGGEHVHQWHPDGYCMTCPMRQVNGDGDVTR
jgi:hypothetical protein